MGAAKRTIRAHKLWPRKPRATARGRNTRGTSTVRSPVPTARRRRLARASPRSRLTPREMKLRVVVTPARSRITPQSRAGRRTGRAISPRAASVARTMGFFRMDRASFPGLVRPERPDSRMTTPRALVMGTATAPTRATEPMRPSP